MFNKTRQKELTETGKSELYTDLTKLIIKIADYIFRKEEDIRKGIGDIMGGKVLELESERLKAEGRTEGEAIGQASSGRNSTWKPDYSITSGSEN